MHRFIIAILLNDAYGVQLPVERDRNCSMRIKNRVRKLVFLQEKLCSSVKNFLSCFTQKTHNGKMLLVLNTC